LPEAIRTDETTKQEIEPHFMGGGIRLSLLIALSWLTEAVHIPYLIYGEQFTPNWRRAILRTVVVLLIWIWVLMTKRLNRGGEHSEPPARLKVAPKVSSGDTPAKLWTNLSVFARCRLALWFASAPP
jgi:hypothetical protein